MQLRNNSAIFDISPIDILEIPFTMLREFPRYLSAAMDYLLTHHLHLSRLFDKYVITRRYSSDIVIIFGGFTFYVRKMFATSEIFIKTSNAIFALDNYSIC